MGERAHDGMPRAYLRIDPNVDQVYPELRSTFVGLLCAASRQPERGRFRDRAMLEALCGKRYVKGAYTRRDVVDLPDGRVYVDGWDEWQEGDWTVAERMRRMRQRRAEKREERNAHRHGRDDGGVAPVTPAPSHRRNDVTTDAGSTDSLTRISLGVGVRDGVGVDTKAEQKPDEWFAPIGRVEPSRAAS
jgi:hypothetical protein